MTAFIIGAVAALALALALLLRPLWRPVAPAGPLQRQLNMDIARDQLARLELDLAEGTLAAADYEQARAEVQRRALQDAGREDDSATSRAPRRTLAALALVLPLAAFGLYWVVGNPASLVADGAPQRGTQPDIEAMVGSLAAKLEREPGNLKGWSMLARSYKVMGRPVDAERAFEKAAAFLDDDAQLLADYADVAATNAGGSFTGKPQRLIDKALQVDPRNAMALWLAGTAAMKAGNYDGAVATWERLSALLEPGSEDSRTIRAALDEVRALGGKGAKAPVRVAAAAGTAAAGAGAAGAGIVSGTVELADALKAMAAPQDTVMVIARVPGSRMPVAVLRVPAANFPVTFTLDDSLSMSPQALISAASEVEVEARISKSGLARPEPGDLVSAVQTVKNGARGLVLRVASVRP